jgi:Spy/CpxP family protein refolding chaperone
MNRRSLITAVLVLIPFIAVSGTVLAQRGFGPPGKGDRMGDFLERNAEELGLDDETTEAIQQVLEEGRERARGLDDALHEAHMVMRDLLQQDVPDKTTVMRQAEVIGELEIERQKHRLSTLIEIRSMLTPEQRELLVGRREARREAMFEACADDFETLCPDVEPGPGMFRCMRSHRDEISDECLDALPKRRHGRRGSHRGPFRR